MGWSGGEILLGKVWTKVRKYVPEEDRREVFAGLASAFWDHDADTLGNLLWNMDWDEAAGALYDIGYLDDDYAERYGFDVGD